MSSNKTIVAELVSEVRTHAISIASQQFLTELVNEEDIIIRLEFKYNTSKELIGIDVVLENKKTLEYLAILCYDLQGTKLELTGAVIESIKFNYDELNFENVGEEKENQLSKAMLPLIKFFMEQELRVRTVYCETTVETEGVRTFVKLNTYVGNVNMTAVIDK